MIEGWFEIRCEECDKVLGYSFNKTGEPEPYLVYSCEECMNPEPVKQGLVVPAKHA